ncbi:cyclin-like protein [Calycina marina]|uniref:Cyclin-like protein n=1 Tax=Calycina marina TaxID=1763456 RepID=A0A9P8CD97_9HELO|nr:cyclin-like protein [Calycina marina]
MDAKPQRPLRSTRTLEDEVIIVAPHPTPHHQRVRSTSVLLPSAAIKFVPTMFNVAGLKGAAKRTLIDVSNTSKQINSTTTKDDSTLIGKPATDIATTDKHNASFVKPAQRPLGIPTKPKHKRTTSEDSVVSPKAALPQIVSGAAKRSNKNNLVVYKDYALKEFIGGGVALPEPESLLPIHHADAITDQATETVESTVAHSNVEQIIATNEVSEATQHAIERLHRQLPALPAMPLLSTQAHAIVPQSETDEYWEEDEEEVDEVYDEQGYTTAHSHRSRGENTTGGVTAVLFPKITTKSKMELADAQVLVEFSRTAEDVEDELYDVSMVAEYNDDIFNYMRELELKMLPNPHYMENQAEIQWSMRSVLMDWIIQVHHRFSLLPETLFLCVNYIDRFLSCKVVSLGKLQLVGATALFVAAKYEEINCPSVSEVVFMVDGGYTTDEILKAERFMLSMLQFELGWPGPMSFLRRISKADEYDLDTRTLAKYFLEVAIMDERFVSSPASYIAAGAHCLARIMLKKELGNWTPAHVHYSGYTWTQIRPLVALMVECCENPSKHHAAVFDKFSDRRYKRGSLFAQNELTRGFVLPPLNATRRSIQSIEEFNGGYMQENRERMIQLKS